MYIAFNNATNRLIRAIDFFELNHASRNRLKLNIICPDCNGAVVFACGTQRKVHFKHKKGEVTGKCKTSKKYIYTKKEPTEIIDIIKKYKLIELVDIEKNKNQQKKNNKKTAHSGIIPGKSLKHAKIENKLIVNNQYAVNLEDFLNFLMKTNLEILNNEINDSYIVVNDQHLKLNEVIVNITKFNWFDQKSLIKLSNHHPHIFWGHIENATCKDKISKQEKKIRSISTSFLNRYTLILKFGNRNFNRPLIVFDTATTTIFLKKLFSTGQHDLQGNVALIINDFKSNDPRKTPKIVIHDPLGQKIAFHHD